MTSTSKNNNSLYFRTNYDVIDLISGDFSEKIHLIWHNRVSEYLTATDFRRHVWCGWLAKHHRCERSEEEVFSFLTKSKSRDIIADTYGSCPNGYLSVLKRLGTVARKPRVYQCLFKTLSYGGYRAKLIHHAKDIDDELIYQLAAVPSDEFSNIIVSCLYRRSVDPEKLLGAVWVASQVSSRLGREQVVAAMCGASNPMRALRDLVLQLPFPSSPITYQSPLFPVGTVEEVRALSLKFQNCLRETDTLSELAFAIQSGQQCLYHWNDEENPALVLVKKFSSLGWVIEEAYGIGNKHLDEITMHRIECAFGTTGTVCLAWPTEMTIPTRGWFFE